MKTKINIDNYGAYWIDYLDGNINQEQEDALFAFLENNPEIAGDLIDPEDYELPLIEATFPGKANLKAEAQTENLIIAKIEKEISAEDDAFITKEINDNPEIAKTFSQYKKTILVANTNIVFPNKDSLKKTVRVPMFRYVSSIAAAIAIVFVAGFFLTRNVNVEQSGTKTLTSNLEFNIPYVRNDNDNLIQDNNTNEIKTVEYTANNTTNEKQVEQTYTPHIALQVPNRIPMHGQLNVDSQIAFSSTEIMEYRYDIPVSNNDGYAYTMQYQKTDDDSKFVAGIKKVIRFGKEVDLVEEWESIKSAKEEILYTSLDN